MIVNAHRRGLLWLVLLMTVACRQGPPAVWVDTVTGMEFVLVPAGRFVMGSPPDEPLREPQETRHEVIISSPFYMGRYEVTQAQWRQVMGSNPSRFQDCGPDCPVESVNWYDIEEFIRRLSDASGEAFRLPTEEEWEYACRAGTTTAFSTGRTLTTDQANFDDSPSGTPSEAPAPVGSYPPNAWDLHDMHGNVWEWCQDWHCPYPEAASVDPIGACESPLRVIRGGSWHFGGDSARCALRYTHHPEDLGPSLGLRLVHPVANRGD